MGRGAAFCLFSVSVAGFSVDGAGRPTAHESSGHEADLFVGNPTCSHSWNSATPPVPLRDGYQRSCSWCPGRSYGGPPRLVTRDRAHSTGVTGDGGRRAAGGVVI